ncbi:MAG: hypothetical protein U0703_20145 [Anaerolineae bacterium]
MTGRCWRFGRGAWWDALERAQITLLVTREYRASGAGAGRQLDARRSRIRGCRIRPASLDAARVIVHIASTRNPNQVIDFKPSVGRWRADADLADVSGRPPCRCARASTLPVPARDLALVGGALHANLGRTRGHPLDDDGAARAARW